MRKSLIVLFAGILYMYSALAQGGLTPTITANGPTSFCTGGSVTLTASQGTSYLWNTSATTQSIVATQPGNYWATVTDGQNPGVTNTINVSFDNKWLSVSTGYQNSIALRSDGTLWAWGFNYNGQLGDGSNWEKVRPVQVGSDNDWVKAVMGAMHAAGIKSNGSLWTWGSNYYGELGIGGGPVSYVPVQVGTDHDWANVVCGYGFTVALKSNHTLWTWGNNVSGSLGIGNYNNSNIPVQVAGNNWISISAGEGHVLAIKSNGTLWAWGWNGWGQLGIGTFTNVNIPVQVGTRSDWKTAICGMDFSIVQGNNGLLYGCGNNNDGQLGLGYSGYFIFNLYQSGTDNDWASYSCGANHVVAVKNDGSLWGWGYNYTGDLGDGTYTQRNSAVQIPGYTNIIMAQAGDGFSAIIKDQGYSLCLTGDNSLGQLGDFWQTNGTRNTYECVIDANPDIFCYDLDPLTYCAGDEASIAFGVTGLFKADNIFTVQLSDANGSFANPVNLATLAAPGPDPNIDYTIVNVTFPSNSIQGSAYRIRVISSSCPAISNDNGSNITINALPDNIITPGGLTTFCQGGSVNLTASANNSYLWSTSETTQTIHTGIAGNYTVTVTSVYGCSAVSSPVAVTVNPLPQVTLNALPATICPGANSVLTAGGASTYVWNHGLGSGSSKTVNPAVTTIYSVTGTDVNGCTNTASATITVLGLPAVTAGASPATVCSGSASTLSANGAQTYTWSNGLGSGTPVTAHPTVNTTYTVTGTDINGCVNTASALVSTYSLPNVVASASPKAVCLGFSSTLTATGANTYTWSHGLGSGTPKTVAPATTTIYTVTGTNNNGCMNIDTALVTVKMPVQAFASSAVICKGQSSTLTATGSTSTYTWNNNLGTGPVKVVSPTSTTTYSVTGTTTNGCTNKAGVTVTVNPLPTTSVKASPTSVCSGSPTTLTGSGATSYTWSHGLGTGNPKVANPLVTTTYTVTGSNTYGCTKTASVTVTTKPLPYVAMSVTPQTINPGGASTLAASGATSYTWSNGLGTGATKVVHPTITTTYTVTGTGSNQCKNTATGTVNVIGAKDLPIENGASNAKPEKITVPVFDCYPNPFVAKTTISIMLPENDKVMIEVFDMQGKLVQVLYKGNVDEQTEYTFIFNGTGLKAGMYLCKLTTSRDIITHKILLRGE